MRDINRLFNKTYVGMAEKAKEFVATRSEIYHGNLPESAKDHH